MTGARLWTWLFAALALLGGPGCVTHELLPDDVARGGVAWSGPPLPLKIGIGEIRLAEGVEPTFLADVARRSLFNVLDRTKVVTEVRYVEGAYRDLSGIDFVLTGELRHFDLYSSYAWWAMYGAFLVIPLPATSIGGIIMIVAGCPIVTDCGELELVIDAIDPRTGRRAAGYRCDFQGVQSSSVWEGPGVDESYVSHPELLFQHACGRIVHDLAQDRVWLLRWKSR